MGPSFAHRLATAKFLAAAFAWFRGGWRKTRMTCVCKYVAATSSRLARICDEKREGSVIDLLSARTSGFSLFLPLCPPLSLSLPERETYRSNANRTIAMLYDEPLVTRARRIMRKVLASPVRSKRYAVRAA